MAAGSRLAVRPLLLELSWFGRVLSGPFRCRRGHGPPATDRAAERQRKIQPNRTGGQGAVGGTQIRIFRHIDRRPRLGTRCILVVVRVKGCSTGAQLLQQLALLAALAMLSFAIDLIRQSRQLLNGEQARTSLHQRQNPTMERLALLVG